MSGICFCTIPEELKKRITGTFMKSDTLLLILHTSLHIQALKTLLNSKGKKKTPPKSPQYQLFHCHFINTEVLQATPPIGEFYPQGVCWSPSTFLPGGRQVMTSCAYTLSLVRAEKGCQAVACSSTCTSAQHNPEHPFTDDATVAW